MQQATPGGLKPAELTQRRCTIACIHNAKPQFDEAGLREMKKMKPNEMSTFLASPDVAVTNQKDKETMLPIVGKTDEHVREMMSGMHRRA